LVKRTKQIMYEKNLTSSEERLNICLSAGNLAWWEMNCITGKLIFNENIVKILDYSIEELSNIAYTTFTDLIHPDDRNKVLKAMNDHLEGKKEFYEVDYRIKTKKGYYKWFFDKGSIVQKNSNGKPLVVLGVVFDITALKKAENELKALNEHLDELVKKRAKDLESTIEKFKEEIIECKKAEEYTNRTKQNLRNIIDSASEVIISFDTNNRVSIWNKTAEKITGYKQIEVLNRSVGKLNVFDNPQKIVEYIKTVCAQKNLKLEDIIFKTKENEKRIIRVYGTEIKSLENECVGALFIGNDITKDIELHKKLLDGNSYLIKDKNNKSAIDLLIDLSMDNHKGLIISRGNPNYIKKLLPETKNLKIALLTIETQKGYTVISDLINLEKIIRNFGEKNKNSIILLDGVHYLITRFSFEKFIETLYNIIDVITKNKSIFFIRIDPSTVDNNQMAIFENELQMLPSQTTEDIIIEDDSFEILKYIFEQNQINSIVSFKKVITKFKITYVTAASKLNNLEKIGLIFTKKQGKLRAIFATDKGKMLLHRRKTV